MDALQGFRDRYRGGQFVRKEGTVELRGVIADARVMDGSRPALIEIIASDVRERTDRQDWYPADALGVVVEDTFEIAGDIEQALDVVALVPVRFLPPGHPECIDFTAFSPRKTVAGTLLAAPSAAAIIGTLFRDERLYVLWLEPLPAAHPRFAVNDVSPGTVICPYAVRDVVKRADGTWEIVGSRQHRMNGPSFTMRGVGASFWGAVAAALNLTHDWKGFKSL